LLLLLVSQPPRLWWHNASGTLTRPSAWKTYSNIFFTSFFPHEVKKCMHCLVPVAPNEIIPWYFGVNLGFRNYTCFPFFFCKILSHISLSNHPGDMFWREMRMFQGKPFVSLGWNSYVLRFFSPVISCKQPCLTELVFKCFYRKPTLLEENDEQHTNVYRHFPIRQSDVEDWNIDDSSAPWRVCYYD
jgi:hypothetical protein